MRTRNARLTAIRSFFHYAALKAPEQAELIARVLSIPEKRFDSTEISYLTEVEITALLQAPDRSTWTGRRDHAMLLLAIQTGLRVSELAALCCQDLQLDATPWVRCRGKGRKTRCTPLTRQTKAVLEGGCASAADSPPTRCSPTAAGATSVAAPSGGWSPSTRLSRPGVAHHLPPRTSPRTRFVTPPPCGSCTPAPQSTSRPSRLWLGHETLETTNKYLHADMELKRRALDRTAPANVKPGRYRPPDAVLAFLESL